MSRPCSSANQITDSAARHEGFWQSDESYYLAGLKAAIEAAIAAGIIEEQPVETLADMIMGQLNEAARLIAHASDKVAAHAREVSESANRMWNGLRIRLYPI